jgi:hypothetical protein
MILVHKESQPLSSMSPHPGEEPSLNCTVADVFGSPLA